MQALFWCLRDAAADSVTLPEDSGRYGANRGAHCRPGGARSGPERLKPTGVKRRRRIWAPMGAKLNFALLDAIAPPRGGPSPPCSFASIVAGVPRGAPKGTVVPSLVPRQNPRANPGSPSVAPRNYERCVGLGSCSRWLVRRATGDGRSLRLQKLRALWDPGGVPHPARRRQGHAPPGMKEGFRSMAPTLSREVRRPSGKATADPCPNGLSLGSLERRVKLRTSSALQDGAKAPSRASHARWHLRQNPLEQAWL